MAEKEIGRIGKASRRQVVEVDQLRRSVLGLTAALGTVFGIRRASQTVLEFERNVTDARKAADIAGVDLKGFENGLIALSTTPGIGSTAAELADLSATAGTLGIRGTQNLLKFSETTAKVAASLRGIGADEVAEGTGKILNITQEGADRVEAFGNVFARLEDSVAGGAQQILRGAKEVATGIAQFGASSTEVLGLGAALSDLGVRAELGRSTVGRSFRAISTSLAEGGEKARLFAELTGQSIDQLRESFATNATDTFVRFLGGLQQAQEAGLNTTLVLEALGLSGDELNSVLPTLAKNHERVAQTIGIARKEEKDLVKLNQDSALVAETLGAKLGLLGRTFDALVLKFRDSKGPLANFVQDLGVAIGLVGGLAGFEKKANDRSLALATGIKGVAIALGLMVATKAGGFILGLANHALTLALNLKKILPLLAPIGVGLAALGAVAAGIEFGRYIVDEFKPAREAMIKFQAAWERFWIDLTNPPQQFAASLARDVVDFGLGDFADKIPGFGPLIDRELDKIFDRTLNPKAIRDKGSKEIAAILAEREKALAALDKEFTKGSPGGANRRTDRSFLEFLFDDIDAGLAKGDTLVDQLGLRFEALQKKFLGLDGQLTETTAKTGDLSNEVKSITQLSGEIGVNVKAEGFEELRAALAGVQSTGARDLLADLRAEISLIGKTADEQRRLTELRELDAEILASQIAPQSAAALRAQLVGLQDVRSAMESQTQLVEELKDQWNDAADTIGNAFGNAVEGIVSGTATAKDAILSLLAEIRAEVLKQTVTQPISNSVSSILQGALASQQTPVVAGAKGMVVQQGSVVPFANGGFGSGIVSEPTYFGLDGGRRTGLVGEAGVEAAFTPLARLPNGRLGVEMTIPKGAGSGDTFVLNQNIRTQDASSFRKNRRQLANDMRKGLGL